MAESQGPYFRLGDSTSFKAQRAGRALRPPWIFASGEARHRARVEGRPEVGSPTMGACCWAPGSRTLSV
eukprot:CAMPEP_0175329384 /NCGR_PEP_ID=MMETSP0095-20121207/166_1 /TAXON_ID=311494 /ORGANISM="Alexandrium monilatum, Strain CCMP3105" /LENGTH=68 /DNA_ID=CAMNT_0016626503 /DNA_START=284 /DNA_END=487 /DNA_ORIENTATION=+